MKILYLHQYFNTPNMIGGTRSYEMAQRMIRAGHEVVMVSSLLDGGADGGWRVRNEDGIEVHWLPVAYSNKLGFWGRLKAFIQFAFGASRKAASIDADVIFATSTPLTIAIPALYASWRQKIPYVFEVRDLWPEAPIQMGWLQNPLLIWLARRLEELAYRKAAHIVALTPGMKEGVVSAGEPELKISMIPNSSDLDLFSPDMDGGDVRSQWTSGDELVLLYFGTFGAANGLDYVVDVAEVLQRRGVTGVKFVLHGDGMTKAGLMERVRSLGLDNIVFSGPTPKAEMPAVVAAADITMTIFANKPILRTNSPNKMFDSFAAGKPVLTNMPGWLQSLVEKNECGVFVQPDDAEDFADKVEWLLSNKGLLPKMGDNARKLAEARFSRDILGQQLVSVLEDACGNPRHSV